MQEIYRRERLATLNALRTYRRNGASVGVIGSCQRALAFLRTRYYA